MYLLALCLSLVKCWFVSFTTFLWVVFTLFLLSCKTTLRTLTTVLSYLPYLLQYLSMFISFLLRSFKDWWHFSYCLQHLWLSFVAKSGNPKFIGSILGFCLLSCWSVSQSWNKYLSKYTCLGKVNSGFIISLFKIFLNYSPVFFTWILIFYENFSILLRA